MGVSGCVGGIFDTGWSKLNRYKLIMNCWYSVKLANDVTYKR